jgi:hypothetical protein
MNDIAPFHLAFPVHDLAATRHFYGEVLGCTEGRSSADWIDFNLFGHQIVAHLAPPRAAGDAHHNKVDGHGVPVPHFGVVLAWADFEPFAQRLRAKGVQFVIEPYIRFAGGGRTGHDVLPRPQWQRAGVQGLPGPRPTLCQVTCP